jgi:hypothetical protein
MKKLLGISVVAMLAVTPLMANADPAVKTATSMTAKNIASNTNIATTSFVGGAYDDVVAQHNKVVADINVTTANNVNAAHSIGQNVNTLDAKMGVVNDLADTTKTADNSVLRDSNNNTDLTKAVIAINNAVATNNNSVTTTIGEVDTTNDTQAYIAPIGTGSGQKTVAQNLQALDDQVKTNADAIALLNDDDETPGSVAYAVKETSELADYTNTQSGLAATTIKGAIDEVEGRVETLEGNTNVSSAQATGNVLTAGAGVAANLAAVANEIEAVKTANNTATTVSNGSYIKAANNVATNLTNLDVATKANADAITSILGSTIPVYSDWANSGSATNTVTVGSLQGANPTQPAAVIPNPGA